MVGHKGEEGINRFAPFLPMAHAARSMSLKERQRQRASEALRDSIKGPNLELVQKKNFGSPEQYRV